MLMTSSQKQPSSSVGKSVSELESSEQIIHSLQAQVEQLTRQLAWFQREVFGQKSERREGDGNPLQLSLGEEFDLLSQKPVDEEKQTVTYDRAKNKKKKSDANVNDSGLRFTSDVEVKEIYLDVPELAGENAQDYEIVSEKVVCRLAARPTSYVVLKYIQPVIKYIGSDVSDEMNLDLIETPLSVEGQSEETVQNVTDKPKNQRPLIQATQPPHSLKPLPDAFSAMKENIVDPPKRLHKPQLFSPPMPPAVIEKSYADVSFIAIAMIDKWVYHLPFHRQQQRLQQNGITLCSGYLVQLIQRVVPLLKPIYEALFISVINSDVAAMDETPTKAGHKKKTKKGEKARGKMLTGYYWPIYGDKGEVVFPFSPSRGGQVPEELLKGFNGTLLTDGYIVYENFAKANSRVTHAVCWAHGRRGFVDAEDLELDRTHIALAYIRELYAIEEYMRDHNLTGDEKRDFRQKYSKPCVDTFFRWIAEEVQRLALLPPDDYSKAVHYMKKREKELRVFLDNPQVQIDTNHLERMLRVIPMGKKNWLFNWTELGAEAAGIVQSLLSTCKLQGINPYDYLIDVLQRIDQHPASRVHELTPRNWKTLFGDDPLRSPL